MTGVLGEISCIKTYDGPAARLRRPGGKETTVEISLGEDG